MERDKSETYKGHKPYLNSYIPSVDFSCLKLLKIKHFLKLFYLIFQQEP